MLTSAQLSYHASFPIFNKATILMKTHFGYLKSCALFTNKTPGRFGW